MYNNTWIWIILIFLLLCGGCGNGGFGNMFDSFGGGCGGNNWWMIIIVFFLICGCGSCNMGY